MSLLMALHSFQNKVQGSLMISPACTSSLVVCPLPLLFHDVLGISQCLSQLLVLLNCLYFFVSFLSTGIGYCLVFHPDTL